MRISTAGGIPQTDEVVRFVEEQVLPTVRQQRGFAGLTMSADPASARISVVTIWETEEDRDSIEGMSEKARAEAGRVFGGEFRVERDEQVLFVTGAVAPGPGAKLFVRDVKMDPARLDEHLAFLRDAVLPDMKAAPGFLSVRRLVDRATGDARVGSLWADEASLRSRLARSAEAQATAAGRGVELGDDHIMDLVLYRA